MKASSTQSFSFVFALTSIKKKFFYSAHSKAFSLLIYRFEFKSNLFPTRIILHSLGTLFSIY